MKNAKKETTKATETKVTETEVTEVIETEVTETEILPIEAVKFELPEVITETEILETETVNFKVTTYFRKGFKTETEIKFYIKDVLIFKHKRISDIPLTHRNRESMKAFKEYIQRQAKNDFDVISTDEIKLNEFYLQLSEKLQVQESREERKINDKTDSLKDFSFVQDLLR